LAEPNPQRVFTADSRRLTQIFFGQSGQKLILFVSDYLRESAVNMIFPNLATFAPLRE